MSDEPVVPNIEPQPADAPHEGKRVIVVGSPEHEALLKAFPNASSYADDIVIVEAPPTEEEVAAANEPEVLEDEQKDEEV